MLNQVTTIEFDDTTRAWNDWKYGNDRQKSIVHEKFTVSLQENTKLYMTRDDFFEHIDRTMFSGPLDVPSLVMKAPELSLYCHICRKYQGQLYPCRICGQVYHQQCMKDLGDMKSYHLMKNLSPIIGWSCSSCEDLGILLSPIELAETHEWIKSLGSQPMINLNTYITTRIKSKLSENFHFDEFQNQIKKILQLYLHTITDISSNQLSQSDLLILDVSMKMFHMSPKFLVHSLTSFELYRLSQFFLSISTTNCQSTDYNKFHEIFNTYLQAITPDLSSNEKNLHIEALSYSFMGNIPKLNQTWTEFVLNSTIPTLLDRYNHRKSVDYMNRTIPIQQRTTSPTTRYLIEQQARHSLTILMNNIFQKLQQPILNKNESQKQNKTRLTKSKHSFNTISPKL